MKTKKLIYVGLISGVAWAVLALLLRGDDIYRLKNLSQSPLIGGVLIAPILGYAMSCFSIRYFNGSRFKKIVFSFLSLAFAVTVFSIACGLADIFNDNSGSRELLVQQVLAYWYGLIFTGYFLWMTPFAYFNHSIVRRVCVVQ